VPTTAKSCNIWRAEQKLQSGSLIDLADVLGGGIINIIIDQF